MPTRPRLLDIVLLLALGSAILLPGIATTPLWDPDEARHGEIARRMSEATTVDELLAPRLGAERYRDKPVLFYWLSAAAYHLVGTNELGARLIPVASAIVTLLTIYLWTTATIGHAAGRWAGIVLITAAEFAALGRFTNPDMLLACCVTLGLTAVERWWTTGRTGWAVLSGIATGLGVLAKGLVAGALVGGLGLAAAIVMRGPWHGRTRGALAWAASAAAVIAPWALAVAITDPGYLRELVWEHHVERFLSPDAPHATSALVYVPTVLLGFFPWSILLAAGVAGAFIKPRTTPAIVAITWASGVILFFSLASGKLPTYLLPAVPPLAVATGAVIAREQWLTTTWVRQLTLVGAGLVAVVLLVAPVIVFVAARDTYGGVLAPTSWLGFVLWPFAVAVALTAWRSPARLPLVLAVGMTGVHLVWGTLGAPRVGEVRSTKSLARMVAAHAAPNDAVVAFGVRLPSLRFYGGHSVRVVQRGRGLAKIVTAHPVVFVVTSPRHEETVQRAGVPHRWGSTGRRVLYASIPRGPAGPGHAVTTSTPQL